MTAPTTPVCKAVCLCTWPLPVSDNDCDWVSSTRLTADPDNPASIVENPDDNISRK